MLERPDVVVWDMDELLHWQVLGLAWKECTDRGSRVVGKKV